MVLVITNSEDVTADYLCDKLCSSHVKFERVDTDSAIDLYSIEYTVSDAHLLKGGVDIASALITSVWLRRPKPLSINLDIEEPERLHIQGEWSEAFEGFLSHIPIDRWMNHPTRNVAASHKMEQLSRAVSYGLQVPKSLITTNVDKLKDFWRACNDQVIAKPLYSGFIERSSPQLDASIYTNRISLDCAISSPLANCPTLFQEEIIKSCDVRVTIVDGDFHSVGIVPPLSDRRRIDIRRNNMSDVEYQVMEIPKVVRERLRQCLYSYGLRFAAVDFVIDSHGDWIFLEINPNGQWAWTDLSGVTNIYQSFIKSFDV